TLPGARAPMTPTLPRTPASRQPVLGQLLVERRAADAEEPGREGAIPARVPERSGERLHLRLAQLRVERTDDRARARAARRRARDTRRVRLGHEADLLRQLA